MSCLSREGWFLPRGRSRVINARGTGWISEGEESNAHKVSQESQRALCCDSWEIVYQNLKGEKHYAPCHPWLLRDWADLLSLRDWAQSSLVSGTNEKLQRRRSPWEYENPSAPSCLLVVPIIDCRDGNPLGLPLSNANPVFRHTGGTSKWTYPSSLTQFYRTYAIRKG